MGRHRKPGWSRKDRQIAQGLAIAVLVIMVYGLLIIFAN